MPASVAPDPRRGARRGAGRDQPDRGGEVGGLPVAGGQHGEAVRDVQRRLTALGYDLVDDDPGAFGPATESAVRQFQERRGLRVDGVCGRQTWSSLVEAGYRLGDRFLYLRSPVLRGDDVADLQRLLGALGFDAGRIDGMFGAETGAALAEFQRNAGLTSDGICGTDTVAELERLGARADRAATVAKVREAETLRAAPRELLGRRVAVGETGGLAGLADALGRALHEAGAVVAVLHHPDEATQAGEANRFAAEAFMALALSEEPGRRAAYYATDDYHSAGGRCLAGIVLAELEAVGLPGVADLRGMRLPIPRETKMPAVVCEFGPASAVVEAATPVVAALAGALTRWALAPVES